MPNLGWLQMTHDPLTLAMRVIHDDLDWIDALGRTTGRRAAPTQKPGQLGTQIVVNGFVESHPHQTPLLLGQPESIVTTDRHVHAPTDQPSRSIGTPQAAALIGAKCAHSVRRDIGSRTAPECRRQGAQSDRDTHDELLFGRDSGGVRGTGHVANRKKSGAAFPGRPDPRAAPTWARSPAILAQW